MNLLDRFLFSEAMEDPVILKNLLEIILGKDIMFQGLPQTEKEERQSPLNRFIKLDVWAMDTEGNIYDAEAQKEDTKNLPRRTRLYQGMIDSKLLAAGELDFNQMNNVFIIMIMPFDLFGEGRYCYTFHMMCEECKGLRLEDGATRIFLNTHGTNSEGVSQELIDLLRYVETTDASISEQCDSERIKDMQTRIENIKSSEQIGVRYMQAWEEMEMEKQKGREEGIKEGESKKLTEQIQKKLAKRKSISEIADELETDIQIIEHLINQM